MICLAFALGNHNREHNLMQRFEVDEIGVVDDDRLDAMTIFVAFPRVRDDDVLDI